MSTRGVSTIVGFERDAAVCVCVLLCAPFILHKAATLSDSSQSHREGQTEKMSQSSFSCLLKSGSVFHISFTRHNFKWNFML